MWILLLKSLILFVIGYWVMAVLIRKTAGVRSETSEVRHKMNMRKQLLTRGYGMPLGEQFVHNELVRFCQMWPMGTVWASFDGNGRDHGSGDSKQAAYRNLVANRARANYIQIRQQAADVEYETIY